LSVADYISVAEDIEWLHHSWWVTASVNLSADSIRRGSTTLRLLLIEHAIQKAWRAAEFPGSPMLHGPDLAAWLEREGYPASNVVRLVAGGARTDNIDAAMIGLIRIDHPETGVSADAEEGFAVVDTAATRWANHQADPLGTDQVIEKQWRIADYLGAVAVITPERQFTRQQVIEYFAHYAGGAHLERVVADSKRSKRQVHESLHRAVEKMEVFGRDGLLFELLSIGQAIGREPSLLSLAATIRSRTA
jgi:hypothetical protein